MKLLAAELWTVAIVLLGSFVQAPQEKQKDTRNQANDGQQDAIHQSGDQKRLTDYFAGRIMLMNESTIRMSEMAEQRATSPEVKEFARQMVEGHRELNQQLKSCAPEIAEFAQIEGATRHETGFRGTPKDAARDRTIQKPTSELEADNPLDREEVNTDSATDGNELALRPNSNGIQGLDRILTIERQATENYIAQSSQMLQRYEGQDFDMGYLGFQIGSHTWALAELEALSSVGSEQFQQIVADATTKVKHHLQEAKELSKKYEDDRRRSGTEEGIRARRLRQ